MRRKRTFSRSVGVPVELEAALGVLSAEALRQVVREFLAEADDQTHGRFVATIVTRAAREGPGWSPEKVSDAQVDEVLAFVRTAERKHEAAPAEMDFYLRRGSAAFLRKDYADAHLIFGALLRPLADGSIYLGQEEVYDDVLGSDLAECASQYVLSAYMLAPLARRAEAVHEAIEEVRGVGYFREPLRAIEKVAVEPLPDLDEFLPLWKALIVGKADGERRSAWDTESDTRLREVVLRLEGAAGLSRVARETKRAEDLDAWCASLVDAGDWNAALAAYNEAAELVADGEYARGKFLDGAALAAQTLGREDLAAYFERAWRESPKMSRLRRWLGAAKGKDQVRARVAEALESCPQKAVKQRALLHAMSWDLTSAAKLLANAPGIGWSDDEHPGHVLFGVFAGLLGCTRTPSTRHVGSTYHGPSSFDAIEAMMVDTSKPHLVTPEIDRLVEAAGVERITATASRGIVLGAMRTAAEKRMAGVTEAKKRRDYGHAAELVAICVACDGTGARSRWAEKLRTEYSGFPALRRELDRALEAS